MKFLKGLKTSGHIDFIKLTKDANKKLPPITIITSKGKIRIGKYKITPIKTKIVL